MNILNNYNSWQSLWACYMQIRCCVWSMMIIALSLYLAWLSKATHIKGIVCCYKMSCLIDDDNCIVPLFSLIVQSNTYKGNCLLLFSCFKAQRWNMEFHNGFVLISSFCRVETHLQFHNYIFFSFRDLNIPVPGQRGFYKWAMTTLMFFQ